MTPKYMVIIDPANGEVVLRVRLPLDVKLLPVVLKLVKGMCPGAVFGNGDEV